MFIINVEIVLRHIVWGLNKLFINIHQVPKYLIDTCKKYYKYFGLLNTKLKILTNPEYLITNYLIIELYSLTINKSIFLINLNIIILCWF